MMKLEQIKMLFSSSLIKWGTWYIFLATSNKNKIFIHMKSYVFLNFHVSKTEYLSVNKTLKISLQQKNQNTINIWYITSDCCVNVT